MITFIRIKNIISWNAINIIVIIITTTILFSCNVSEEKKIKQIIKTSSGSTSRYITQYDESGNITHSEQDYDKYGPSDEIRKYHYVNDNLMKMEWYFRNGSNTRLYMTDFYSYNNENKIYSKITKYDDGRIFSKYDYKYKTVGNNKELVIYQSDSIGNPLQEWEYEYDSMDRTLKKPREYQGSILGTINYQYFGKDSVEVTELNYEGEVVYVENYTIDSEGNFIKNNTDKENYKWKNDKYGNWIEKEIIQQSDGWTEYREIEYY